MALKTSLERFARILARAVHNFAAAEGWQRDEYIMTATIDRNTYFIFLEVGSVRPVDAHRWFRGIMEQLALEFGSWASAAEQVNLIIRPLERLDQIFQLFIVNDEEIDLTDMLTEVVV